jgi:hypothetical protein
MSIPSSDCDENGVVLDGPFKGSHTKPHSVQRDGKNREIVWHRPVEPTAEDPGRHDDYVESHPAWGLVSVHRVSTSPPGAVLFDSDIRHSHFYRVSVERCTRARSLSRDWIHGKGRDLIEIEMSAAQWAAFVSSTDSSGVPCTIRNDGTNWNVDGLLYEPRLHESMDEVKEATQKMVGGLQRAIADLDALDPKAGVKERRAALAKVRQMATQAESNTAFVAKSLEEHAEKVTRNMQADIEAMVLAKAQALGLTREQGQEMLDGLTASGKPIEATVTAEIEAEVVDLEETGFCTHKGCNRAFSEHERGVFCP